MPTFLRPALSDIEWSAHYEGEKLRAREQHRKLTALKRYFSMQRGLRADVPVTLCDAITPIPESSEAPTLEMQAVVASASEHLKEELVRIRLSKIPTGPLPNVYVSIAPEIWEKVPTQPLGDPGFRTIRPAITTQASTDKHNGLISRSKRGA